MNEKRARVKEQRRQQTGGLTVGSRFFIFYPWEVAANN